MDGMLSTNLAARYVETPLLGNASLVISLESEWESLRADQSSNSYKQQTHHPVNKEQLLGL